MCIGKVYDRETFFEVSGIFGHEVLRGHQRQPQRVLHGGPERRIN